MTLICDIEEKTGLKTVIFDIDGTLSDNSHRQHFLEQKHKDWEGFFKECEKDKPILHTIIFLDALKKLGYKIIIITGRPTKYKYETIRWLKDHLVEFDELLMRPYGNFKEARILKEELFQEVINKGYSPEIAFDDEQKIIDLWKEKGIRTFLVK